MGPSMAAVSPSIPREVHTFYDEPQKTERERIRKRQRKGDKRERERSKVMRDTEAERKGKRGKEIETK